MLLSLIELCGRGQHSFCRLVQQICFEKHHIVGMFSSPGRVESRIVTQGVVRARGRVHGKRGQTCYAGVKGVDKDEKKKPSIVDGVMFRMAELLGMVVISETTTSTAVDNIEDAPQALSGIEGVERKIENLYQSSYFFSGQGREDDWDVFDDSCVFADEFSSFVGTDRFRRNVTNFGKFLQNPECSLTKLEWVRGDDGTLSIKASWIFRSQVKWINGLLAAAGETTYVVSDGRVVRHDEAWKTPKSKVLQNLFFKRSP